MSNTKLAIKKWKMERLKLLQNSFLYNKKQ